MKLSIGLGLSHNRGGGVTPVGPTITAPGSIDVSTFKIGTTQTMTAGMAIATGGGTVTYEFRHLSDGEVKSSSVGTDSGYAHVGADDTENGTAQWRAVESGGSNDGATSWQTVASGTITYPAPTASGALSDQSFTENSGDQTYDASGDFTGSALVYSLTTAPAGVTINSSTGVVTFDTDTLSVQSGTSIVVTATNSGGSTNSGFSLAITAAAATAPSAFVGSDWSVAAGSGHKELDITIATLPNNGGSAITDIEYDVDASGTWVSLGTATTGSTTVTMAAGNTSYAIRLRAVNSVGNATPGNSESATSAALAITGYSFNGTDTISFSLNGTGTLYSSTTSATETDAADIENGVGAIDTDTDVLSSGSNNITVSYPNTFDDNWLNLVVKSGSEYSNVISNQYTFGDIVPRAFVNANWSVATGSGSAELDITIASLPSNGGATITDVEYDVDASGTWISLGATSGTTTVTMAAASTSYAIRLRAVNSVGNGLTGNSESATSGSAAATVPSAFVDANWSVATGSGANELDITIASLPANGGATITDVEYDVDGGGSWTSLAATSGTITVTMAAASTSYGIRLRAVNSVGSGAAGNTESATSGAAAGNPELLVDPGFDDASKWSPPGGVTIASSQAQWRTAAAFSTFWTGSAAANLAAVNENTDYTWSATIENYTGGGNFQCQVTFYNSSFGAISTPSNNVNINSTGDFTTTLTAPAGAAYAAFRAKPFSANYDMDWSDVSLKEV